MRRLTILPFFACLLAAADYPCEPPPEIREAVDAILDRPPVEMLGYLLRRQQRTALDKLAAEHPGDYYLRRKAAEIRFIPEIERQKELAALRSGDDAFSHYLLGRMHTGHETPVAIQEYTKALELAPELYWAHLGLAQIYEAPNFRDPGKLRLHLLAGLNGCPANVEGYQILGRLHDSALADSYAPRLRAIVEARQDKAAGDLYRALWTLEFQATPVPDHEAVRSRIESDLRRLVGLPGAPAGFASALAAGFRLLGKPQQAARYQPPPHRPAKPPKKPFQLAYEDWSKTHPYPKLSDLLEKVEAHFAALHRAAQEWITRWPEESWLYGIWVHAARLHGTPSPEEVNRLGGAMEAVIDRNDDGGRMASYRMELAALYAESGVRLDRVPELVQAGFRELQLDRVSETTDFENHSRPEDPYDVETRRLGQLALVKAAVRSRDFAEARSLIRQMGFDVRGLYYWEALAELAVAEKRKIDALFYYQKSLAVPDEDTRSERWRILPRVRLLWLRAGGTEGGWKSWLEVPRRQKAQAPCVTTQGAWKPVGKTLPEFRISDQKGRIWTQADFRGKTTFVNIWATWCAPCREELPQVERLWQRLKGRKDVALVSISIDDNPATIIGFAKAQRLSFPALAGGALYESMITEAAVPRNWIVDRNGVLLKEQIGFANSGRWLDDMLAEIEKSK